MGTEVLFSFGNPVPNQFSVLSLFPVSNPSKPVPASMIDGHATELTVFLYWTNDNISTRGVTLTNLSNSLYIHTPTHTV